MIQKDKTYNLATFFCLYIAQTIPMSFFSTVIPVMMRQEDFSLSAIGLLQLIKLPWILKFLWSPMVDRHAVTTGDYKRWIFSSELIYAGLIGTLAMLKPWLVDLGYDMKEIGVMSGVAGTFVGFLSSFAGGMIVRRIGRFRARILFAVFVLMATLYFLGLSYVHPTTPMLYGGIFLLWGSYGMATIVVYTTAMDCVRPGREGTDFTIQTVITHLSGMLMAILSGRIADHTGYHGLFFFEASIALVSLIYIVTVFRKDKNTI